MTNIIFGSLLLSSLFICSCSSCRSTSVANQEKNDLDHKKSVIREDRRSDLDEGITDFIMGDCADNFLTATEIFHNAGYTRSKCKSTIRLLTNVIDNCGSSEWVDDSFAYLGYSYLLLGEYDNASLYFRSVANYPNSTYSSDFFSSVSRALEKWREDVESIENFRKGTEAACSGDVASSREFFQRAALTKVIELRKLAEESVEFFPSH